MATSPKAFERTSDYDERFEATRSKGKKPCSRCGRPLRKVCYNVAIDIATEEVLARDVANRRIQEEGQWDTSVSSMEVGASCFKILKKEYGLTDADGSRQSV